jgi:hypothetical protein
LCTVAIDCCLSSFCRGSEELDASGCFEPVHPDGMELLFGNVRQAAADRRL